MMTGNQNGLTLTGKRALRALALQVPQIRRLLEQKNAAEAALLNAIREKSLAEAALSNAMQAKAELATRLSAHDAGGPCEILPGTPYSRYAVPIEYLPSRDYRARWGYSHPREPLLNAWFRSHLPQYSAFLSNLRAAGLKLADIPRDFDESRLPSPAWLGTPYGPIDAVALYAMVHRHRPRIYLEVGSGITTCFAHKAIRDSGLDTRIISIDPEPRARIDAICDRVERVGLEVCDLALFEQLEPNDILFFDGSHRSFMNSDVTVFMIDVLPRLKPGVIVHVHDIFLPFDYPDDFKRWYWNEQYLLAIYLIANRDRINPLWPAAFVDRDEAFAGEDFVYVDLGEANPGWRGGGAMWFTHTR